MDVDTSAAIERLSERIDVLDVTVREGFTSVRGEFASVRKELGELRGELGGELATVRAELGGEIGTVRLELATVRRDLDDLRAETRDGRRHTEVLFESLRDDIRIIAEGFAAVSLKLDSLQR